MDQQFKKFLEFNGKTILFKRENSEYYVAIKPICEALEVNYRHQLEKIKTDVVLMFQLQSMSMIDAGGKLREMYVLPERFIYGWIFSINGSNNTDLIEFKWTCYTILFDYFRGSVVQREEILVKNYELENRKKDILRALQNSELKKELNAIEDQIKANKKALAKWDHSILNRQLSIFE